MPEICKKNESLEQLTLGSLLILRKKPEQFCLGLEFVYFFSYVAMLSNVSSTMFAQILQYTNTFF